MRWDGARYTAWRDAAWRPGPADPANRGDLLLPTLLESPARGHAPRDRLYKRSATGLPDDIQELVGTHVNTVAEIISDDDSLTIRRG